MFKDDYRDTFSKVTASGETYRRVMAMKNSKKTKTGRGAIGKILVTAAILSALTVTASAAENGWFRRYFEGREPLSTAEVEYIEKIEQPINEAMVRPLSGESTGEETSQDGYTLRVKSVITDGNMAYITIGITGPQGALLSRTEIPGYSPEAPSLCTANFLNPGFFEPAGGGAQLGYCRMGAVEDHDGLDCTQDLLLTVEAEMEDGTLPFGPDKVWKLHLEDLTATYFDLEAQKALDEQHGSGEYISFGVENGINPFPQVVLAAGSWDYEIRFADNGMRTVELAEKPVTATLCIQGRFDGDPDVYQEVEITSFTLSSLSAAVVVDTDGFPELQDYGKSRFVCVVMKDGSQVELRTASSDGPGRVKLEAVYPIDLDNADYVLLADGTKIPMP